MNLFFIIINGFLTIVQNIMALKNIVWIFFFWGQIYISFKETMKETVGSLKKEKEKWKKKIRKTKLLQYQKCKYQHSKAK